MEKRCNRRVGTSTCGLPKSFTEPGQYMGSRLQPTHWPHRYVEDSFFRRAPHEFRLWRRNYTDFNEMVQAIFTKRVPVDRTVTEIIE